MNEREKVLEDNYEELTSLPNVLSARADQTKITGDVDTGEPCITVYTTKKVPERYKSGRRKLRLKDTVRKEYGAIVDGEVVQIKTDVVVLSSPNFELGKTDISSKPPSIQRRMMGVRRFEE